MKYNETFELELFVLCDRHGTCSVYGWRRERM